MASITAGASLWAARARRRRRCFLSGCWQPPQYREHCAPSGWHGRSPPAASRQHAVDRSAGQPGGVGQGASRPVGAGGRHRGRNPRTGHPHPFDHFDGTAVAAALRSGGVLAYPAGLQPSPWPQGARARPSALWEPQLLGDFTATPVPASDGYGDTQVSWVVSAGGRRIFHGGDTQWHGNWWRIGRQFGPFDAAFLPSMARGSAGASRSAGSRACSRPSRRWPLRLSSAPRCWCQFTTASAEWTSMSKWDDPRGRVRRRTRAGCPLQIMEPGTWLQWPEGSL